MKWTLEEAVSQLALNLEKASIAQAFKELQQLCAEENYSLEIPTRSDRDNPFSEDYNEYSL